MVAIKIDKTGRYLSWDGGQQGFYETEKEIKPIFSENEVENIFESLKKKYIYNITVVDAAGNVIKTLSAFAKKLKPKREKDFFSLF